MIISGRNPEHQVVHLVGATHCYMMTTLVNNRVIHVHMGRQIAVIEGRVQGGLRVDHITEAGFHGQTQIPLGGAKVSADIQAGVGDNDSQTDSEVRLPAPQGDVGIAPKALAGPKEKSYRDGTAIHLQLLFETALFGASGNPKCLTIC